MCLLSLGLHLPPLLQVARQPEAHQDGRDQEGVPGALRVEHQEAAQAVRRVPAHRPRLQLVSKC